MARRLFGCLLVFILPALFSIRILYAWDNILQGQVRETYDDNITSAAYGRENDFISEFMVGIGVRNEGKVQVLDVLGHVFQHVYAVHPGLSNNYQDLTVNYTRNISEHTSFRFSNIFQNFPDPDRFEILFGNSSGRMRYIRNNFDSGISIEINKHYAVILGYSNQFMNYYYKHTRRYYLDNIMRGVYINRQIRHSLTQTFTMRHEFIFNSSNAVFINYSYLLANYYPGLASQSHTPSLGYRHNFTNQLYFECMAAPEISIPARTRDYTVNGMIDSYRRRNKEKTDVSLYALVSLVDEIDQRTSLRLWFMRQNTVLSHMAQNMLNWQFGCDMNRQIFPRLSIVGSLFYGQGIIYSTDTNVRLFGLRLSGSYDFTDHISGAVFIDHILNYTYLSGYRLNSKYIIRNAVIQRSSFGYSRNRLSLALQAEF
jgi:hypothetical protein